MHLHESVFFGIVFFLVGVFFAPTMNLFGLTLLICIAAGVIGAVAYKKNHARAIWMAALMLCGIIGAIYWTGYNTYRHDQVAPFVGKKVELVGHVTNIRRSEKTQRLIVRLDEPNEGRISATVRAYPTIDYGDSVRLEGLVQKPQKENWRYLLKDALFATMQFPELTVVQKGDGNSLMTMLIGVRHRAVATYKRLLPANEAALLAGITLGERAEFDAEFKEKMANSGTTHLVALSGYNISVVAGAILLLCGFFMRRTVAFYATFMAVVAFVAMAGAEASVVRAAIMGSIVLLASYMGRTHSMRNAIAVSACAMVLWNPNALRYDLGFQLSFGALIGIVYLKPYVDRYIKRKENGFMQRRENLSGTLSAQVMVFPLLMQTIGSFSAVSLISNVAVLFFIPITMMLGFVIAALGFIAIPLAVIPAWAVSLLLKYEISVIELFGAYKGFSMPMTAAGVAVYYAIMGWLLRRLHKHHAVQKNALCHPRRGNDNTP